jgi:hypothetical protein
MSGQTLSDIVSSQLTPMLERNTVMDRMHAYVVRWTDTKPDVDEELKEIPLPCDDNDTVLSVLLRSSLDNIHHYVQFYARRNRPVPKQFNETDNDTLDRMLSIMVSWVNKHRYDDDVQLLALGLNEDVVGWFISPSERSDDWSASFLRVIFQHSDIDCSIGVWLQLFDLTFETIWWVRKTRVYTLTHDEKHAVLEEALMNKRREKHPESFQ